jgi:ABC-2 type transport system permease protein
MNGSSATGAVRRGSSASLVSAIAGREVRAALSSPLAYTFTALFVGAALVVFFLVEQFFAGNQASARGLFAWMPRLLVLVCPALTMRVWAEERKLGSYELLATLPLRPWELVLGKFLGTLALLAGALLCTLGIPIVAALYGDLDWGPVVAGYLVSLLLGAAYLAIGLVCSALVSDQILALFLGWVMCGLSLLPDAPFWGFILPFGLENVFRGFGFGSRFEAVVRGLLDSGDLIFFLSATGFFLFLNVVILRWRRLSA